MFSTESHSQINGTLPKPAMPGLGKPTSAGAQSNPFAGIKRAGQAKRAQNFEKFQQSKSDQGTMNQNKGGLFGTQSGSMKQNSFA
jgi:hypothetical protein